MKKLLVLSLAVASLSSFAKENTHVLIESSSKLECERLHEMPFLEADKYIGRAVVSALTDEPCTKVNGKYQTKIEIESLD
jgi:hypothetical protein